MKKSLKYLFALAAIAFGLVSCKDDLIPSKDTYAGYKGVTGDFAYIVGGTMSEYDAVTAEVQHTTIGELGTVEKKFEVALTKEQASDVAVSIVLDNEALLTNYSAFPEGVLKFPDTVTIPAGSLTAEVTATVSNSDFPKLVDPLYMAVFRIAEATGVSVSTNSNKATLYVTTEVIDPADNLISIAAAERSFNVTNYTNETLGDVISYDIDITGSDEAFQSFDITLAIDNSLIAAYNEKNGTSYIAVPEGIVSLTGATMEKSAKSTRANISIADADRSKLSDDNGYLIPVRLDNVSPATLATGSGVVYIIINVVNFDYESNMFSALYLGDYRMSTWYIFDQPMDLTVDDGYTYVFHIFIDEVTRVSRIGDFADANENWINMLRFGQKGNYDTRLEWFVGPNGCRKNLYTQALEPKTWYQIALTYVINDGYYLYVEGELVDSYELTDSDKETMATLVSPKFQAIEFNSSWGANYREGNEFHGRIWNFSVWNTVMPAYFLKSYLYRGVSSTILYWYAGYCAHWAFDDGVGSVVKQTSGRINMGNIDFTKTTRCDDESNMVSADVSEYIQWVADEYNKFD